MRTDGTIVIVTSNYYASGEPIEKGLLSVFPFLKDNDFELIPSQGEYKKWGPTMLKSKLTWTTTVNRIRKFYKEDPILCASGPSIRINFSRNSDTPSNKIHEIYIDDGNSSL